VAARCPLKSAQGVGCWVRSLGLAGADAAAVARRLLAGSPVHARPLLRCGFGAGGHHVVKGQRARRSSRGVLCRVVSALCAAEALGEGLRVRGRAALVALRFYLGRADKWLSGGGRGVGCAAPVALRSRRYLRSKHFGGPARRLSLGACCVAVSFAANGQLVGRQRTCRRSRGVCCRAVPAPLEVKSLGGGAGGGGCAAFAAAGSRRRVRSIRWREAGAWAVARPLLPRGPGTA